MLYHTFSKLNGKCNTRIKSKKAERETEIKLETCFSRTEVNFVSNVDVLIRHKFWNALNNKNCLCQTIFALVLCDSTKINLVYFILCSSSAEKKSKFPSAKIPIEQLFVPSFFGRETCETYSWLQSFHLMKQYGVFVVFVQIINEIWNFRNVITKFGIFLLQNVFESCKKVAAPMVFALHSSAEK